MATVVCHQMSPAAYFPTREPHCSVSGFAQGHSPSQSNNSRSLGIGVFRGSDAVRLCTNRVRSAFQGDTSAHRGI